MKDRNEKTLPNTCSTIPDCPSHIDRNEYWCLGDFDQDSISSHKLELEQFQTLDKLASFSFNEIELECECDPDPQPCDSVPIFKSMLTSEALPTNFWWSHSIDGERIWILFFWFGPNYWINTDSRTNTLFSKVSNGSIIYHSWAQVNHSTKSHSFVRHRYRQ